MRSGFIVCILMALSVIAAPVAKVSILCARAVYATHTDSIQRAEESTDLDKDFVNSSYSNSSYEQEKRRELVSRRTTYASQTGRDSQFVLGQENN